jgi:hypothetical protein
MAETVEFKEKVADRFIELIFLVLIIVVGVGAITYIIGGNLIDLVSLLF